MGSRGGRLGDHLHCSIDEGGEGGGRGGGGGRGVTLAVSLRYFFNHYDGCHSFVWAVLGRAKGWSRLITGELQGDNCLSHTCDLPCNDTTLQSSCTLINSAGYSIYVDKVTTVPYTVPIESMHS